MRENEVKKLPQNPHLYTTSAFAAPGNNCQSEMHICLITKLQMLKAIEYAANNVTCLSPFPKRQILDCSKVKEVAEDNFKFDKNC